MRTTICVLSALGLVALTAYAEPVPYHGRRQANDATSATTIDWSSCGASFPTTLLQCAVVDVPLDYARPSVGYASLAVARYMHQVEPRKGSIFFNPGGPGESGVQLIASVGERILNTTGQQYDIVTWDPRATGDSLPAFGCFQNADEEAGFWNGSIAFQSVESKGDFTNSARSDPDVQAFLSQINATDSKLQAFGKLCVGRNDIAPYIGTVSAVRDMLTLNDAIEGVGSKVNYWGFSYGTVIASVLTNMFPDRVGRVVYDSVVNPILYSASPAFEIWDWDLSDTDGAFQGFLDGCAAAGPSGCAIATKGSTSDDLRKWVYKLSDDAFDHRVAGGDIGSADIKNFVFNMLYTPTRWAESAQTLKNISMSLGSGSLNGTTPAINALLKKFRTASMARSLIWDASYKESFTPAFNELRGIHAKENVISASDAPATTYALEAITCADASDLNYTTTDVFNKIINTAQNVPGGQFFASVFGEGGFYCHRWPARAVERYSGPWNAKLSTKALIVSNKFDPITPRKAGILVADLLGANSATFIEREGFGHISFQEQSTCINNAIGEYLKSGTIPTNGTVCALDNVPLFSGSSSTPSSGNGTNPNKGDGKGSGAMQQFMFSTWLLFMMGIPILSSILL